MRGHLNGYVKKDIKKYLFMTMMGNLGIKLFGVLCERTHGLWVLNGVVQSSN